MAIVLPILVWQHITPHSNLYFFLLLGAYPTALIPQLGLLVYRNTTGLFSGADTARSLEEAENLKRWTTKGKATITNLKDVVQERLDREIDKKIDNQRLDRQQLNHDIIQIDLELNRHVRIKEGQYIGLWIPAVGKLSFLQVHPFIVTSWAEGDTRHLRLLVEPRRGWTKKLLRYAKLSSGSPCRALFTGPYGTSISTRNCGIVLLVASGVGIVAQIPYLKQLVHDYNACRTLTRRIHLIWQLETMGMLYTHTATEMYDSLAIDLAYIFEKILNEALFEDTLDEGRVCIVDALNIR